MSALSVHPCPSAPTPVLLAFDRVAFDGQAVALAARTKWTRVPGGHREGESSEIERH